MVNGLTVGGKSLALDAATQPGPATSAYPVESVERATAKTARERMFVVLAAGQGRVSDQPLSARAWRAATPA